MSIHGVIFDLDGVICYTDEFHYLAWKKIADSEHIYFDREINNRLRGVSRMDSLNIILERANRVYSLEEKNQLAEKKNNIYISYLDKMDNSSLASNVVETLTALRKRNIKLAIGSSSKNTKFILNKLKLTEYFDAICDGNMITYSKPNPEVFLKACSLINEKPSNCIVVEDALSGIEASHKGGFISVGILQAKNSPYVDYKIDNLIELLDIVK